MTLSELEDLSFIGRLATARNLSNLLLFQSAWWSIVLLAEWGALVSLGVAIATLGLHLSLISRQPRREFLYITVCAVLGAIADGLFSQLGGMSFTGRPPTVPLPSWLIALWLVFPTTLSHSLQWLFTKPLLMVVLAFIFGPLTYWTGTYLSLLEYTRPLWIFVPLHGCIWAGLMLTFAHLSRRIGVQR